MYGPRPAARLCNEKNGVCLIKDSDGSSGPSGELAFPPPVWTWVRNLWTCERLRTIAAAFYLSFLLFSVVVVGVFLLPTVRNVGAGEEHWFGGVQTPHSGRARNAWHSPHEGPIVCRQLHVLTQNPTTTRQNVAGGSSCLRTHSTRSLCARPTAPLQQLSTIPSLQCYMLLPRPKKLRRTAKRKPNKGACKLERSRACATCA